MATCPVQCAPPAPLVESPLHIPRKYFINYQRVTLRRVCHCLVDLDMSWIVNEVVNATQARDAVTTALPAQEP